MSQKVRTPLLHSSKPLLAVFAVALVLLSTFTVLIHKPRTALAATSNSINFQARLMNASGGIVPDGFYNVEFKIYNAVTSGTLQFTDTYYDSNGATAGNDARVRVANGYLTVSLGSQAGNAFPSTIKWDQQMWITMNIGGTTQTATPTWDGEMSPRLQLTAVPYAFRAGQLASLAGGFTGVLKFASTFGQDTDITLPDPGASTATVCYQGSASCGFVTGTSAGFIQNGTTVQTGANFNIRSAATGSVGAVVQGANGQTADLLQLQSWNGTTATNVFSVNNSGVVTLAGGLTADVTTPATTTATAITIKPGTSSGNSSNGAALTLRGGDGSGTTTVTGGAVAIQGGNASGGSGTRTGGDVTIDAGTGAAFTNNGVVTIGGVNAKTLTLGATASIGANTQTINIGTLNTTGTQNVTIGSGSSATGGTTTVQAKGAVNITGGAASTWDIGNNQLSLQTTNNGAITTGTGLLTQGGNITFNGTAARTITGPATGGLTVNVTGGPLTLSTTTSGALAVTSAGALNFTGAANSTWTVGAGNTLGIVSSNFNVTTLGVLTTTSAALTGANALTLGTTGTNTGAILFKGATAASGVLTLIGPANPSTNTITLPNETGTVCTTAVVCTGYAASSVSGNYLAQVPTLTSTNTVTPTAAGVVGLTVNATSGTAATAVIINQSQGADALAVNVTGGSQTNGIVIDRTNAGTLSNGLTISNTSGTVTNGLAFSGTIGTDINRASGVLSLQGTGGVTVTAGGTTTLGLDTAGAGTVNLGNTNATTIGIGSAASATTTIGGGNVAHTIAIGAAGTSTIQGITLGSQGSTSSTTIQGGTGAGAISMQAGASGTILIGNTNSNAITLGGTSGTTTLNGTIKVNVLGAATANSASVCRDTSTTNLTACDSTNTTGRPFLQGGNAFGATGVLGTTDANGLQIVTGSGGPNVRATFDTGNNLFLGNASTTGTAATPNNFAIQGTGSATAGTAGATLTIQGGAGASATTGSAGGGLLLAGGNAAGSGNNNGGTVTLQGGGKTNTGIGGGVLVKNSADSATAFRVQNAAGTSTILDVDSSQGYVGIGTAAPIRQLDLAVNNTTVNALPLLIEQAGTGDTGVEFKTTSKNFYAGIDNTDGQFKISSAAAANGTFTQGNTTQEATPDSNANGSQALKMTASASGVVSSMSVYISSVASPNNLIQFGIYSDNGSGTSPNALLGSTSAQVATVGWNTISISGVSITNGTVYWLAMAENGTTSFTHGTGGTTAYHTSTGYPLTNPFAANTGNSTDKPAFYITVATTGTADYFGGTNLFRMNDTGAAVFQNASNSTASFQVQNAAGTSLFTTDTTNSILYLGSVGSATGASTVHIADTSDATGAQAVTIGSAAANTGNVTVIQGGSNTTQAIQLLPNTAGGIMVGAATGTGTITLGQSTATNTISIGSAIPTGTNTQTINIGNGAQNTATNSTIAVNILSSATNGTGGTAQLNLGNNDRVTQINIGNVVADASRTLNVFSGNTITGATDTINIATGNTVGTGAKVIHIGDGTPAGTNTVTVGSIAATANVTTIQGGNGAGAVSIQAATSGTINVGDTNSNQLTLGGASSVVKLGNLGASTTNAIAVCRDSSTSNLIACGSGTGNGTPFLQGGNSFNATGVLGTSDNFALQIKTNNIVRATFDNASNNLYLGLGITNATPTASGIQATGSTTAGTAGAALTIQGGAGASATTGSAGGAVTIQGGNAAGSGGNAGGNIILTPGTKTNAGAAGIVLIQPASGNDSTSLFNIKNTASNNVFTVDSANARVGIGLGGNNVPTLAAGNGIEIADGSLRFSGNSASNKDLYVTPGSSPASVRSIINVVNFDPGANSQILAMGLPSTTANANTRAISVFDARAGVHQPTISLFSVDENSVFGLSWDGSSSTARLKTDGTNATQASILIQPAASTAGTAGGSTLAGGDVNGATVTGGTAFVLGGNATGSGTRTGGAATIDGGTGTTTNGAVNIGVTNSNNINIGSVGSTAKGTAISIGTTTSTTNAQTVTVGSLAANAGNITTIQGGSGAGAVSIQAASSGTINVGTTNNNQLTLGGASSVVKLGSLGSSTATAVAVCRDSSTSNLIACGSGGTGAPFLQGGNSFNTTGVLGTSDNFGLQVKTNNIVRATFDNATNGLYLGLGVTNATPTAFTVAATGSATAGTQGAALAIQGGAGATTTTGSAGGNITISGGAGGGTNANSGGDVILSGGAGSATGIKGVVNIGPMVFAAATTQTFSSGGTITQSNVDNFATVLVGETTTAGAAITLPDPLNTTAGRTIYVTSTNTSLDFTLTANAGTLTIAMRKNATATMIWNGADWTPGGADSSTTLQAAYNNTLISAGGAEIVLNNNSNTGGLTIRDNVASPISGSLLEVQSAIGTNILSVNNFSTELMANGGAEDSTTFSTNWTLAGTASAPTRTTTAGQFATGQAGVSSTFGTAANNGVRGNLGSNPATGTTYLVSFTAKLASGSAFTDLRVDYTPTGAATGTQCTANQTIVTTTWTKITCEVLTPGTAVTNPDIIIYQPTVAGVSRVVYIDNLSMTLAAGSGGLPANVQIGGGINGGQVSLFTLDRSSAAPVAGNNSTYLGSLYYDTTIGRIQCYESDGWGSCGSAPDNIIILTPEFAGATLNGAGIGAMTSDFCAQQASVLNVNTGLCPSGEARNFYQWTSPQSTQQVYSIYVSYKLPSTFKNFSDDNTINLTARTDNTSNAFVTYEVFKSTGTAITACGTETTVTTTVNTWQTVPINGNENTTCAFGGSNTVIFKINVKAQSNANAYVGNLTFTYTNN